MNPCAGWGTQSEYHRRKNLADFDAISAKPD